MQYNKTSSASLQLVIARYLPAAQAAGCFSTLEGLSGGSLHFKAGAREYVARNQLIAPMPGVSLRRQYRALKHIHAGMGPRPVCLARDWLIVEWLEGDVKTEAIAQHTLSNLLYQLHKQPCFGWRISLLPLLEYYWQHAVPSRRCHRWLRLLKCMKKRGEPRALRLAPLHMDIHPGNIIHQVGTLRLIDWEYAGDGDIALELAATMSANGIEDDALIQSYALQSHINVKTLKCQVARWQPWVIMLMASWYECRFRQTEDRTFLALADEAWCRLRVKNK